MNGITNDAEARRELRRRQDEWLYEDRYGTEPAPMFTREEAQILAREHRPVHATPQPFTNYPPASYSYCIACNQQWTNGGCPTARLLYHWFAQEKQIRLQKKRNQNMAEFLAEYFGQRLIALGRSRGVVECRLVVDRHMLESGRMMVVDELLAKMRDQWKDFLEKMFPPSGMEVAAKAFGESLANMERAKRRAEREAE